jgi:hypothetical protein
VPCPLKIALVRITGHKWWEIKTAAICKTLNNIERTQKEKKYLEFLQPAKLRWN